MLRSIFFLIPFLTFQSCRSQKAETLPSQKDDNSLLWEISGKGLKEPSYLFGTFHLMCKKDIAFSTNLLKGLERSNELYLEMDLDDAANTLGAIFFMNMKDGKTLKDLYTPEDYNRLEHFFKDSLQTGLSLFQKMKPNFLEAMLYPKMMPCAQMSGIEQELMIIAKKQNKTINGFETIAFQAGIFDSIPYEKQAEALLQTIDSIESYSKTFNSMLEVYQKQHLDELQHLLDQEPGFSDTKEVMLDNRNKNWVIQLREILPEKNIFIAVGAGHLVGENGLISLLKKEGYTLRPIENTTK
jgi:hypothetical protein